MKRAPRPSAAQIALLVSCWERAGNVSRKQLVLMVDGARGAAPYNSPTLASCVKNGWLEPDGVPPHVENERRYQQLRISRAGFLAIEFYLMDLRNRGGTPMQAPDK